MKLFLCSPRGFCAGVVRAIDTVNKALEKWGAPIYVKHEIVHNKHVIDSLKKKGAVFVNDLSIVPEGARIIYSAHGVSPKVKMEAKKRNLKEIDATCVLVNKLHLASKNYSEKGYIIILIGHRKHVEVIGTAEEAIDKTIVVESKEDIEKLNFEESQKLFYITQTTLSILDIEEMLKTLKRKFPKIESLPSSSICYATTNRQKALISILRDVDIVLVIGDPKSSNSNRLKELAEKKNVKAYLVNFAEEIDPKWFKNIRAIGMTAGASTPEFVIKDCIKRLREIGVNEVIEKVHAEENVVFPLPKELD